MPVMHQLTITICIKYSDVYLLKLHNIVVNRMAFRVKQ